MDIKRERCVLCPMSINVKEPRKRRKKSKVHSALQFLFLSKMILDFEGVFVRRSEAGDYFLVRFLRLNGKEYVLAFYMKRS